MLCSSHGCLKCNYAPAPDKGGFHIPGAKSGLHFSGVIHGAEGEYILQVRVLDHIEHSRLSAGGNDQIIVFQALPALELQDAILCVYLGNIGFRLEVHPLFPEEFGIIDDHLVYLVPSAQSIGQSANRDPARVFPLYKGYIELLF